MAKCGECGQILTADVVRCSNCGMSVASTRPQRELDEPLRFSEQPAAVIDLRDLSVVDLRDLVIQLNEDATGVAAGEQATAATSVAGGTAVLAPVAVHEQWAVQAKTSNLLFPHPVDEEHRPTTDDIAPPATHHDTIVSSSEWTATTVFALGGVVAVILLVGIIAALTV